MNNARTVMPPLCILIKSRFRILYDLKLNFLGVMRYNGQENTDLDDIESAGIPIGWIPIIVIFVVSLCLIVILVLITHRKKTTRAVANNNEKFEEVETPMIPIKQANRVDSFELTWLEENHKPE